MRTVISLKIILVMILWGLISPLNSFAQERESRLKASVFSEIFGNAGFFSMNIDLRFLSQGKSGFALRGGYGGNLFHTNVAPVEMMYLYQFIDNHSLEAGAGINILTDDDLVYSARLGYRYQDLHKSGLFFKLGFTPYYRNYYWDTKYSGKITPFGGISIGYSF